MQENLQPEELEVKSAAELDTWITTRFTGQEQLAALPNLDSQTIDLAALAQDLLSLVEDIQPNHDFVLDLEAKLRRKILNKHAAFSTHQPTLEMQQTEINPKDS
ncbi:MAG: hypothetical protein ACAF41_18515 [Leptolyngbya sp. BL-A-14]